MKIVINAAYGGFELSKEFYQHYKIPIIETEYSFYPAKDDWTENFRIREYDGQEWIETENDIDWEIAE